MPQTTTKKTKSNAKPTAKSKPKKPERVLITGEQHRRFGLLDKLFKLEQTRQHITSKINFHKERFKDAMSHLDDVTEKIYDAIDSGQMEMFKEDDAFTERVNQIIDNQDY